MFPASQEWFAFAHHILWHKGRRALTAIYAVVGFGVLFRDEILPLQSHAWRVVDVISKAPVWIWWFGAVLLVLDSAYRRQAELATEHLRSVGQLSRQIGDLSARITKLEERRPRVRIDYEFVGPVVTTTGAPPPIVPMIARNAGEIEAKRVHLRPIQFAADHRLVFHKLDVLGTTEQDSQRMIRMTFHGVDWTKTSLPAFIAAAYFADTGALQLPSPDAPATPQSTKAMKRKVYGALGVADGSVDMRMTYYDNYARRYSSKFRLKFRILGLRTVSASVELLSESEPITLSARHTSASEPQSTA